jgi:alkylation response protein AidB-like acyl-CoA dehydrogenase
MTSPFADSHEDLRAIAREILGAPGHGPGRVRDWSQAAAAGWPGLELPEALGGAGATFAEAAIILEELGRVAASSPYLGVVLGVGVLGLVAPSPSRDQLARELADGAVHTAVALNGEGTSGPTFRVDRTAGGPRVFGEAVFVPDAIGAGRLLLPALDDGGTAVVVVVESGAAALTVEPQVVVDATRDLARVSADGVEVGDDAVWAFAHDPEGSLDRLEERAATATACDCLGLAAAMLDTTVAYAGVRHQFGRPIGSFQAVKHACADMAVEVAVARELVAGAVHRVALGDDASTAASMAKAYAADAAVAVTGSAMQLHGGIGYTWESGVHVYLKRATLDRSLFGAPASHRRRLAARHR